MRLNVVGINHHTAPVGIREKVAISNEKLHDALFALRSYVPQGIILSTCNRTEIYSIDDGEIDSQKASLDFFRATLGLPGDSPLPFVYTFSVPKSIAHLFRVASGLESMVIGEFEVLGQIRTAVENAESAGMVNLILRHVFDSAIRTGRRVREETEISKSALSVSSVTVEMAAGIVGDLTKCQMLVVGAGEAGRLVAEVAQKKGTAQIVIASRTEARASALATELKGKATDLTNLAAKISTANIVVGCAGAPHSLINSTHIAEAMKHRPETPLVIIDIAMPRNVDEDVTQVKNVFLYNLDDLDKVAERNRQQRKGEIHHAEEIIADELGKLADWWRQLQIRPVVTALMSKAEQIRAYQLEKTLKKLPPLSEEQHADLESMTKSIVTKILRDPIQYLQSNGHGHSEMVKELFQLDTEARS